MNKIVREHYPVAELPANLREGLPEGDVATITIEVERAETGQEPTLADLLKLRRPPWLTPEQIQAQIDDLRGEFDE